MKYHKYLAAALSLSVHCPYEKLPEYLDAVAFLKRLPSVTLAHKDAGVWPPVGAKVYTATASGRHNMDGFIYWIEKTPSYIRITTTNLHGNLSTGLNDLVCSIDVKDKDPEDSSFARLVDFIDRSDHSRGARAMSILLYTNEVRKNILTLVQKGYRDNLFHGDLFAYQLTFHSYTLAEVDMLGHDLGTDLYLCRLSEGDSSSYFPGMRFTLPIHPVLSGPDESV